LRLFIDLTPFIFSNPIPFIPFPLIRGRGVYIREAKPPFDSPLKKGGKNIIREALPLFDSSNPASFGGGLALSIYPL